DLEIGRFLTEHDFRRIPRVAGAIEYHPGPLTLAILQELVPNQGDGWSHAIDEVGRYFERASGRMHGPDPIAPAERPLLELAGAAPPAGALEVPGPWLHAAGARGRRTAELPHRLADSDDPAFAPRPLATADLEALAAGTLEQGRRALATLEDNFERLPADV